MEGNERMIGRSRMASNYFVDEGLVCVFEPHLASVAPAAAKAADDAAGTRTLATSGAQDARTGGGGFSVFASYVHQMNFSAMQLVKYWKDPSGTHERLATRMGANPRVNHVKTIDGGGPAELGLAVEWDEVTQMLRTYVDSVVAGFQSSWTPEEYLAANKCARGPIYPLFEPCSLPPRCIHFPSPAFDLSTFRPCRAQGAMGVYSRRSR